MKHPKTRDVLVLGGGIAGMQSALLLAEKDRRVHVLDNAPAIGGYFPLLDRQFPTNSCGVCFMSPKPPAYCPIYESEFHENIQLLTNCAVEKVSGGAGNFTASFVQRPTCVDEAKCTLCDKCAQVCPVEVADRFGDGLGKRKAAYMPFPQAIPRTYVIDENACTRCGECVKACPHGAINLDAAPRQASINVGAIVLGFGFEPFQGRLKGEFGAGRYTNVLTGIQYERLLSTSGPTGGVPRRVSDGEPASKVAFIQCVGSRDIACGREYCSSVCCMYATKQAVLSKERLEGLDAAVFYMDIRAMGKDYERYYERAKQCHGVRYIRSAVSTVRELQQSKKLVIGYGRDGGELQEEEFDMVVLSVGFSPPDSVKGIAQQLGVALNEYGFCKTDEFRPTSTSVPGVFVAGAFREPRDIPDSVVEAGSASADVSVLLDTHAPMSTGTDTPGRLQPLPVDYAPRVGVFLCEAKGMLASAIDVTSLEGALGREQEIVAVARIDSGKPEDAVALIRDRAKAEKLTNVVMAGYNARKLVRLLQQESGPLGLGAGQIDYVNVGEQCASAHLGDRDAATRKAAALIRGGVRKAARSTPRKLGTKKVQPGALVVGGGVAGLSSALSLAEQDMDVTLVEQSERLGGNALNARYTLKGSDVQGFVRELADSVESNAKVRVLRNAELTSLDGTWGNYRAVVKVDGKDEELRVGAAIFATGAREMQPQEYLLGANDRVVTQRTFEQMLADGDERAVKAASVVMIQCVGSRDDEHPWCSRVCCGHAVKNSLKLKELNPQATVHVLNRDIRTYGFAEKKYLQARDAGVIFVRYDVERKPIVSEGSGKPRVSFVDEVGGGSRAVDADLLVLSVGMEPAEGSAAIAEIADLERNADGFCAEANPKSAPLDSVDRGKYFCGLCHSPMHIEEAVCQGKSAAARASALLWQGEQSYADNQAHVNKRSCCGCGLCVSTCPYDARRIEPVSNTAQVLEDLCKGCGTCTISCPNGASQQYDYERVTIFDTLDEMLE